MASVDEILKGASGKDSKSQESASGLEQPKKLNQDLFNHICIKLSVLENQRQPVHPIIALAHAATVNEFEVALMVILVADIKQN